MKLNKKWKIYCTHSSHTDIGYTDTQEEMEFHHIRFIHEVIDILNASQTTHPQWSGFKWTCESFWCVQKFLENADDKYISDFVKYVKQGYIALSGSYLNLTELVSENVLDHMLKNERELLEKYGLATDFAMTADINGYSMGFADVLHRNGINNLFCCLHTHHGYHPFAEKQNPFYWETAGGAKIFVWNGEHYNLGNELGFPQSPDAFEYTIRDGLDNMGLDMFEKAEKRIFAYLKSLEEASYAYDFVPANASGIMSDNSPPSVRIIEFINRFNQKHVEQIELIMSTPAEFFEKTKNLTDIPTHKGDWTDWWADGVGSTPDVVAHYKDAVYKFNKIKKLDPACEIVSKTTLDEIAYNLIFYAEHTWGYSSSISEPWHPYVNYLDMRKSLFAGRANSLATISLDDIARAHGKTSFSLMKNCKFRVINPHDTAVKTVTGIKMEVLRGYDAFEVADEKTGESVPYQLGRYSRGLELGILADLAPKETKTYTLRAVKKGDAVSCGTIAKAGLDGVGDLAKFSGSASNFGFENDFFKVIFSEKSGITSIFDKKNGQELITSDALYHAFTPIYEVTPIIIDQCSERRNMGRNRKSVHTNRYVGELSYTRVNEDGSLYTRLELGFNLEGLSECAVIITAYKTMPKMDIDIRFHKSSIWNPENLYLAMPFVSPKAAERTLWIDKTAAVLRPRVDQLPATCTDFYLTANGAVANMGKNKLLLGFKDNPLIMMGDIKAHPIKLMGEQDVNNNDYLYLWLMNNFWETNFKASLGGFYQFRVTLALSDSEDIRDCFKELEAINEDIISFYMFD